MSLEFAVGEVGRSISILTTCKGRILERLACAHREVLSHVARQDIPDRLLDRFDLIIAQLAAIESLTEDEGVALATLMEDLSASLDDELGE